MSNILNFQSAQHLRCESSASARACSLDPDLASESSSWHAVAIAEIHNSLLLLDLAARRARLTVMQMSDQPARQSMIGQIETIEGLLQLARDMARRL